MPATRLGYWVVLNVTSLQFKAPRSPANIRPRVLVVDDRADHLETISAQLGRDCDLKIAGPERPAEYALAMWRNHPELLLALVDLQMPDQQGVLSVEVGFELIQKLRERPGAVIMILSAMTGDDLPARAKALGIAEFVRKEELDLDELVAQLQRYAAVQAAESELNHNWALGSPEVLRQYGGKAAAVYNFRVIATGRDHLEAQQNALAQPECPDQADLTFVAIPRQPWFDDGFLCRPFATAEPVH